MDTYIITFSLFDHSRTYHYQGCVHAASPEHALQLTENWVCTNTGFGTSDIDDIYVTATGPGIFKHVSTTEVRLSDED